jgi:Fanconi anemia group M protein
VLYRIAHLEQVEAKKTLRTRSPETKGTDAETLEYILSGFPGIDTVISRSILTQFGTLEKTFMADENELMKVRGVGPKTANRLRHMLTLEYPAHREQNTTG